MTDYKIIGWWFWSKMNPDSKMFTTEPLTDVDKANGYQSQPVYIDVRETP